MLLAAAAMLLCSSQVLLLSLSQHAGLVFKIWVAQVRRSLVLTLRCRHRSHLHRQHAQLALFHPLIAAALDQARLGVRYPAYVNGEYHRLVGTLATPLPRP